MFSKICNESLYKINQQKRPKIQLHPKDKTVKNLQDKDRKMPWILRSEKLWAPAFQLCIELYSHGVNHTHVGSATLYSSHTGLHARAI